MTKLEKLLSEADRIIDRLQADYEKELISAYKTALKKIKEEIAAIYDRYGDQVKYADMLKLKRLQKLNDQINEIVINLKNETTDSIKQSIRKIFEESYYRTGYTFVASTNGVLNFSRIDQAVINASIKNALDKIGWQTRNRKNILEMTRAVREEITQGLIQGKGYSSTAHAINDRLNIGVNKSIRIVRTETHRVQNQARSDAFGDVKKTVDKIGIDVLKIWDATLDGRTRPSHGNMDGKQADENGKFNFQGKLVDGPGMVGDPSEDINCRCRIRYELKGYSPKVRRDNASGELIEYKTYNEWKKALQ